MTVVARGRPADDLAAAIGYAKAEFAAVGTELEIEILGERKKATVVKESPYDPDNLDLRA